VRSLPRSGPARRRSRPGRPRTRPERGGGAASGWRAGPAPCPLRPAAAQLGDVDGDRIVQGQAASLGEPGDHRRHHRPGQGSHGKPRGGGHRLARGRVRDAAVGGGHRRVAEHADRGSRDRVHGHALAEQARHVEVAHWLTLCRPGQSTNSTLLTP
jgi:hypothetical protein